jgi:hypothetical protein
MRWRHWKIDKVLWRFDSFIYFRIFSFFHLTTSFYWINIFTLIISFWISVLVLSITGFIILTGVPICEIIRRVHLFFHKLLLLLHLIL